MKPISKFAVRNISADLKYIKLLDEDDAGGDIECLEFNRHLIPITFIAELAATCPDRVVPFGTLFKPSDLCGEQYYAELDREQQHVMGLILVVLAELGLFTFLPPPTDHPGGKLFLPELGCHLEDIPTVAPADIPVTNDGPLH